MKTNIIHTLILVFATSLIVGCSDVNQFHDKYLEGGEIDYVGIVDTFTCLSGYNRMKVKFTVPDPRAQSVRLNWFPHADTLYVDVSHRVSMTDTIEVIIGNSTKPLVEDKYTVFAITLDDIENRSIKVEGTVEVFGDVYKRSLGNRILKKVEWIDDKSSLKLHFKGPLNAKEDHLEVRYTDQSGKEQVIVNKSKENEVELIIEKVDKTKLVAYRSGYLPTLTAIDMFYSTEKVIDIP